MSIDSIIDENSITKEKIVEIFKAAFMDIEESDDNRIYVKENWPRMSINIFKERFEIRFLMWFEPKKVLDELIALQCINKANREYIMLRLFMDIDNSNNRFIVADYYLSFKGGITAYHIIDTYRKVQNVAKELFSDNEIRNILFDK